MTLNTYFAPSALYRDTNMTEIDIVKALQAIGVQTDEHSLDCDYLVTAEQIYTLAQSLCKNPDNIPDIARWCFEDAESVDAGVWTVAQWIVQNYCETFLAY